MNKKNEEIAYLTTQAKWYKETLEYMKRHTTIEQAIRTGIIPALYATVSYLLEKLRAKESHATQASNIPVEWERDVADDLI